MFALRQARLDEGEALLRAELDKLTPEERPCRQRSDLKGCRRTVHQSGCANRARPAKKK
jgi:hypothetical protein